MPDISMCPGIDCPMSELCYRHVAKPTPLRQAWSDYHRQLKDGDTHCNDFLPLYDHPEGIK